MICEADAKVLKAWVESVDTCPVDYSMDVMKTVKEESCGKCVLCREGSGQAYEIIKDITEGKAESDDYELLIELLSKIKNNGSCLMSRTGAYMCFDLMKKYEDEWDKHIRRKLCSNMVCKGTYTVYVDPGTCDGCGKCLDVCATKAIRGGDGLIHVIDPVLCSNSLKCIEVCPKGAVKKAGSIKPKVPADPVPVGSFGHAKGEEDGGRRRRRRR